MNQPSGNLASRRNFVLLVLLLAIVWFGSLDVRKLVRPDEGRYAEIAREMSVSGDWVTPRLNDIKYFYKPALQYWATAAAYNVFGEHEWTARLWPALTGFLGVLFTAFVGCRFWGREVGLISGAIAASSLLYVLIAHLATLDMGVSFFLHLGIGSLMLAQRDIPEHERSYWMWLAWAALALAVLSKGLIGGALPAAALVIYTVWSRDWAIWKRMRLVSGIALLLAITAPWFVVVSLRNPEFFHYFFIHEHFERFLTKVHSRYQPPWYFIPILLAGMLPWTLLMLDAGARALFGGADRQPGTGFQPRRFLIVWIVFVCLFFSVSSSKLPSYILPIFPAIALVIAEYLGRVSARRLIWHALPALLLGVAAAWLAPSATRYADAEVPLALYQGYVPWLVAAGISLAAGALACLWLARQGKRLGAVLALAAGGLLASQLTLTGHDNLSPANSAYHIAQKIKPHLRPGVPFYSIGIYEQTLPFYIKRTVTLVEHKDELSFGIAQEPEKFLPSYVDFEKRWRNDPYALAIMHPNTRRYFDQHKIPYEIIAQDTRRLVVKKPATTP